MTVYHIKQPLSFSVISFQSINKALWHLNQDYGISELVLKSLNPCAKIKTLDYTIWRRGYYLFSLWDRKMSECYFQSVLWVQCQKCKNIVLPNFKCIDIKTYPVCPICGAVLNKPMKRLLKMSKTVFDVITTNNCFQCFNFDYNEIENMGFCTRKNVRIPLDFAFEVRACDKVKN